jgi:hypothetical protein
MYTLEITSVLIFGADIATDFFIWESFEAHISSRQEIPSSSNVFWRGISGSTSTPIRGRHGFVVADRGYWHNGAAPWPTRPDEPKEERGRASHGCPRRLI